MAPLRLPCSLLLAFLLVLLPSTLLVKLADANISFKVRRGVVSPQYTQHRGRRLLGAAKMGIMGSGPLPRLSNCVYAEIKLGDSDTIYRPELDTSTDLSWLYCHGCTSCPNHTNIPGHKLQFYDYGDTSKRVDCSNDFCKTVFREKEDLCMEEKDLCRYNYPIDEGLGSSKGYLVNDTLKLEYFTDDKQSKSLDVPIILGCGVIQKGTLMDVNAAVDGILSLGHDKSSFITQVTSQLNLKRMFGHCFSKNVGGGGIFVIGEIDMDPFQKQTAIYDVKQKGYVLQMLEMSVGEKVIFDAAKDKKGPKNFDLDIASGLTYLPMNVFHAITKRILLVAGMTDTATEGENHYTCMPHTTLDSLYEIFPNVTIKFAPDAIWTITPQNYLYKSTERVCMAFLPSGEEDLYILSGAAVHDRIISYDLEKNTMSWMNQNYECENPDGIRMKGSDGKIFRVPYTPPVNVNETAPPPSTAKATEQLGMGNSALLLLLCIILFSLLP